MDKWNEIRTAYEVASLGTVTAAAEKLGVHRATVIRHIDTLEAHLGAKVFHRHSRGYTTTELGVELLDAARRADAEIERFVGRSHFHRAKVDGVLVIGAPSALAPIVVTASNVFCQRYPHMRVQFVSMEDVPQLELGETHVFFHIGPKPTSPDYVVQHFVTFRSGLYAHKKYLEECAAPESVLDFPRHRFVTLTDDRASEPNEWLKQHITADTIAFKSNDRASVFRAVVDGLGIGFLPASLAARFDELREIRIERPDLDLTCWSVSHVDIHRTAKLQAFFRCLKDQGFMGRLGADPRHNELVAI